MLISAVVKFALWPLAIKAGGETNLKILKNPRTLLEHNGNIIISLLEVGLLGGLSVRHEHMAVAPIYGLLYVLFSWFMMDKWEAPIHTGPQCFYYFLDTSLGWITTASLLVLITAVVAIYQIFAVVASSFVELGDSILLTSLAIAGVSATVCRFRD